MHKYLLLSFVFLSFAAFANPGLGQLGEDSASDKSNCYRKEIQGCGPCFKLCMEQNSGDRGAKDVGGSATKTPSKKGSSSASSQ